MFRSFVFFVVFLKHYGPDIFLQIPPSPFIFECSRPESVATLDLSQLFSQEEELAVVCRCGGMASLGRTNIVNAIVNDRSDRSGVMVMMSVRRAVMMMMVMVAAVVMGIGVSIASAAVVAAIATGLLPLAVFLVLHPPVLEPDLDLTLRQVEIARQLPAFLLRNVGVEQELFLQFQCLEFGVRFPLLAHRHLAGPLQRIRS